MRLARPVLDAGGGTVAGAGTQLGERVVRLLRRLAVQTVVVADAEGLEAWQTVLPLEDELARLEARFATAPRSAALAVLRDAIARRLARRAADGEP
jgi:hypothetical protein